MVSFCIHAQAKLNRKDFGNLPSGWEVLNIIDVLDGLDLLTEAMCAYLAELCASVKVKALFAGSMSHS